MIISNNNQSAVHKVIQAIKLKADYQSLAIAERHKLGKSGQLHAIDGGLLVYAEPNAMVNIAIGMGMGELTHASEQDLVNDITRFYHERGSGIKLETSMLARPGFIAAVFQAGYYIVEVNNVYHQYASEANVQKLPSVTLSAGYEVTEVDSNLPDFDELISVILIGYGIDPEQHLIDFYYDWLNLPGQRKWAIRYSGQLVGGFSLLVIDSRAYFSGASIAEAHRGKGLHHLAMMTRFQALLSANEVHDYYFTASHCSVSAVNAERFGFKQIDTRLAWRLAGPIG